MIVARVTAHATHRRASALLLGKGFRSFAGGGADNATAWKVGAIFAAGGIIYTLRDLKEDVHQLHDGLRDVNNQLRDGLRDVNNHLRRIEHDGKDLTAIRTGIVCPPGDQLLWLSQQTVTSVAELLRSQPSCRNLFGWPFFPSSGWRLAEGQARARSCCLRVPAGTRQYFGNGVVVVPDLFFTALHVIAPTAQGSSISIKPQDLPTFIDMAWDGSEKFQRVLIKDVAVVRGRNVDFAAVQLASPALQHRSVPSPLHIREQASLLDKCVVHSCLPGSGTGVEFDRLSTTLEVASIVRDRILLTGAGRRGHSGGCVYDVAGGWQGLVISAHGPAGSWRPVVIYNVSSDPS